MAAKAKSKIVKARFKRLEELGSLSCCLGFVERSMKAQQEHNTDLTFEIDLSTKFIKEHICSSCGFSVQSPDVYVVSPEWLRGAAVSLLLIDIDEGPASRSEGSETEV